MPPSAAISEEYVRRLSTLSRQLIPRPVVFQLAVKSENAFNASFEEKVRVHVNETSGDPQGKRDGFVLPAAYKHLCSHDVVAGAAEWSKVRRPGVGLYNLGNTCFLNSVLQCLTYTTPLAELALQKRHTRRARTEDMYTVFERHVARVLNKKGGGGMGSFSPSQIVSKLRGISRTFQVGRQEDAHEFLRTFVDSLQKASLRVGGKSDNDLSRIAETTVVHQIFGGYVQSQVKCRKCNFSSTRFDACLDVSLELNNAVANVASALKLHTVVESLDRDNRWHCTVCRKLVPATKRLQFRKLPTVLILHLKRFSPFGGKFSKAIKYNLTLDMKPFMTDVNEEIDCEFSLYGVLVHSGHSTNSGHYYCFVKAPSGAWYEMNDSDVHQVGAKTVLQQQAYILFYQKSKLSKPPVSVTSASPSSSKLDEGSLETVWDDVSEALPRPMPREGNRPLPRAGTDEGNCNHKVQKRRGKRVGVKAIFTGFAGSPVLRRYILNQRAVHAPTAAMSGFFPSYSGTAEAETAGNLPLPIDTKKPVPTTVSFRQGEETVRIHGYSKGAVLVDESVASWKSNLTATKKDVYKTKYGHQSAWEYDASGDGDRMAEHLALNKAVQKIHAKEDYDRKRQRKPDEWDAAYDAGKTKKIKEKSGDDEREERQNMSAKFQLAYDKKKSKKTVQFRARY